MVHGRSLTTGITGFASGVNSAIGIGKLVNLIKTSESVGEVTDKLSQVDLSNPITYIIPAVAFGLVAYANIYRK
jgi:hypothetical protein